MNKKQIANLVKAAAVAGAVAFIQALEADAPTAWTSEPYWPIIGAVATFAITELERLSK